MCVSCKSFVTPPGLLSLSYYAIHGKDLYIHVCMWLYTVRRRATGHSLQATGTYDIPQSLLPRLSSRALASSRHVASSNVASPNVCPFLSSDSLVQGSASTVPSSLQHVRPGSNYVYVLSARTHVATRHMSRRRPLRLLVYT